jgi:hypothetical protein
LTSTLDGDEWSASRPPPLPLTINDQHSEFNTIKSQKKKNPGEYQHPKFCVSFYDVTISDYTARNDSMIGGKLIGRNLAGNDCGLMEMQPLYLGGGGAKATQKETSARRAGVSTEIRTEHLKNTNLERNWYTNLLSSTSVIIQLNMPLRSIVHERYLQFNNDGMKEESSIYAFSGYATIPPTPPHPRNNKQVNHIHISVAAKCFPLPFEYITSGRVDTIEYRFTDWR